MVSASTGDGLDRLLDRLAEAMPAGPHLYPDDDLTDLPDRLLAAEIVREQIFLQTHEEIPYGATVETESCKERPDGSVRIEATDLCRAPGPQGDPDRRRRQPDQGDRRQGAPAADDRCWSARSTCSSTSRSAPAGTRRRRGCGRSGSTTMEVFAWSGRRPAIVLDARPYGEGDALVTVLTEAHGAPSRAGARRRRRAAGRDRGSRATSSRRAGSRGWPTSWAAVRPSWCIPPPRWRWMIRWRWPCWPRPARWRRARCRNARRIRVVFAGLVDLIADLAAGETALAGAGALGSRAAGRTGLRAGSFVAARSPGRRTAWPSSRRGPAAPSARVRGRHLGAAAAAAAGFPARGRRSRIRRTGATGCS